MNFCKFISNWSVESRIKAACHPICDVSNASNYFSCYPIKHRVTKACALKWVFERRYAISTKLPVSKGVSSIQRVKITVLTSLQLMQILLSSQESHVGLHAQFTN